MTQTETVGMSAGHVDVSLWFAFAVSEAAELRHDDREFGAVRWWPAAEIVHGPDTRFEPHLPRLVEKLEKLEKQEQSAR